MNNYRLQAGDAGEQWLRQMQNADPSAALPSYIRNLNRCDCPLGNSLVSIDLSSDEISATGSPQSFALFRMTFL